MTAPLKPRHVEWIYVYAGRHDLIRPRVEFDGHNPPFIVDDVGGCIIWTGTDNSTGYGQVWHERRRVYAHRFAYVLVVDPSLALWPGQGGDRVVLDHDVGCPRSCINTEHLAPTTNRENTIRGRNGVLGQHASRFIGVCRRSGRWRAQVTVDGRKRHLGTFATEVEAATVYDAACILLDLVPANSSRRWCPPPTPNVVEAVRARFDRWADAVLPVGQLEFDLGVAS